MSYVQAVQPHNLSDSPFPVKADPNFPRAVWHDNYPVNPPPGLDYTPLRVERLLLYSQERYPERVALRYYRANWTYNQLIDRIKLVAANLQKLGVRPGDRILVVLPNCPEFVVVWFTLHWLGTEIVPVNPMCSASELSFLDEKSKVRVAIGLDIRLAAVLEMTWRLPTHQMK